MCVFYRLTRKNNEIRHHYVELIFTKFMFLIILPRKVEA
jgi:hypothetical protein